MTGNTDLGAKVALRKKVFDTRVIQAARTTSFFLGDNGMMGGGMGSSKNADKPIYFVDQLTNRGRGDECIMPFVMDIDTDGIANDNPIGNNVVPLVPANANIKIGRIRIPMQSVGKFSEQKTVIMFKKMARDVVAFRLGELTDEIMFQAAAGVALTLDTSGASRTAGTRTSELSQQPFAADITAPSTNRELFAGSGVTATSGLTANDKMNWNFLIRARAFAELKRLKPLRIAGKKTWCVVMHTNQGRDLRQDPDYKAACANGGDRGSKNGLFTGMMGNVDGLCIFDHQHVCTNYGGTLWGAGNTVEGAQALLIGAQAIAYAKVQEVEEITPDTDDWGNQEGHGLDALFGVLKLVFPSRYDTNDPDEDFSLINLYTAAAQ